SRHDHLENIYHHNIHIEILKSYVEKNREKIFRPQINHPFTGRGYTNLSNIINQYRFDDNKTLLYRQNHSSKQNAPYRSQISPYSPSQILLAQQIFRPQIHPRVPAQPEISNLLGRTSHVVHSHVLYSAPSTLQPSDQVTRERHTVQYTEPEITHKRQIG